MSKEDIFTELDEKINDFIYKYAKEPEYLVLKPETMNRLYIKVANQQRYVAPVEFEKYHGIKILDATKAIIL